MAFGSQHTLPLALAAMCVGLSALLLGPEVVNPPRVLWLFVGLAAYTGLQLLPLPLAWVEVLSPSGAVVWRDAFTPFGERAPRFVPLSVDPGGTALELLKWTALPCALLAALAVRARRGSDVLAALLFASALLVAFVTLIHGALDLNRVYGLFDFGFPVERWSRGPLLNGNHLAGYVNLGLFSGVGLLIADRGPLPRWLLASGTAVLSLCTLLSLSRTGVALLGVGALATTVMAFRRSRSPSQLMFVVFGLGASLLALVVMVLGSDRIWTEVRDARLRDKTAAWGGTLDLVRDFPIFGVGRGAFETGFQPYREIREHDWTTVFSHPENLPLQFVAEWGIPVGVAALFAFGFVAKRVANEPRDWVGRGMRIGLVVLIVHNLADFSLEVFGVALAAVVAYGAASCRVDLGDAPNTKFTRALVGALAFALVIVGALRASPSQVERRQLAAEYRALAPTASPAELRERVRSAAGRHPGESYFHLLAGLLARRAGENPLPFLGQALARGPINGTVHLALASAMAERGALSQALLHLRLAARYDVLLREQALARVASWGKRASVIVPAFPEKQPGGELLPAVCPRLQEPERIACLRAVLQRSGADERSRNLLAVGLIEAAEGKRAPCADPRPCREEVSMILAKAHASDWMAVYLRTRGDALEAEPAVAAEALLKGCPQRPEAAVCAEAAVRYADRAKNIDLMHRAAERYLVVSCPGRGCAGAHRTLGDSFMRLSASGLALEQYRRAAEEEPTPAAWISVAEAAQAAGAPAGALRALDRATASGGISPSELDRVRRIRQRIGEMR